MRGRPHMGWRRVEDAREGARPVLEEKPGGPARAGQGMAFNSRLEMHREGAKGLGAEPRIARYRVGVKVSSRPPPFEKNPKHLRQSLNLGAFQCQWWWWEKVVVRELRHSGHPSALPCQRETGLEENFQKGAKVRFSGLAFPVGLSPFATGPWELSPAEFAPDRQEIGRLQSLPRPSPGPSPPSGAGGPAPGPRHSPSHSRSPRHSGVNLCGEWSLRTPEH